MASNEPLSSDFADSKNEAAHVAHLAMTKRLSAMFAELMAVIGHMKPETIYDGQGLALSVLGDRTGRDFLIGHPFQIFDAGSTAASKTVSVYLHSHLSASIRPGDSVTISGLDFPFSVVNGTKIWLELKISTGTDGPEVDEAAVQHGAGGWADYPEPVAFEGDYPDRQQTRAYVELAYVVAADESYEFDPPGVTVGSGSDAVTVINLVHTHMLAARTCYQSEEILYPIPWWGTHVG